MSISDILNPPTRISYFAADRSGPACDHAWDAVLARVGLLSDREVDVFRLLAKGASNRTIATRLAVTERTAKAHVAGILSKLDVESRLQAGIVGYAWEILSSRAEGSPP